MNRKTMPTSYFLALLVLSLIAHFTVPIWNFTFPPFTYVGILLIIFGIILNLWTDQIFKKQQTTVKPYELPTALQTSGLFRLSRHPMYLGMLSILLGVSLITLSVATFIFPMLYLIIIEIIFIPAEEKNLTAQFETDYLNYQKRVRRWI